jgi:peptidoglycan/LPS O-acetylase OafA/YrhL
MLTFKVCRLNQRSFLTMKYIPSFDGIRAISVLLVILFHWKLPLLNLKFGWVGVSIFFVLSGFLITSILVKDKGKNSRSYFSSFFIKRSLRIFPVYYLYLVVIGLLFFIIDQYGISRLGLNSIAADIKEFETGTLLLFTYTFNYEPLVKALNGSPISGSNYFGHLWSLSVEEQFYLLYPVVVYFASRAGLKAFVIAVLLGAPVLRFLAGEFFTPHLENSAWMGQILYRATFFQADSLALGAVLAIFRVSDSKYLKLYFWFSLAVTVALGLYVISRLAMYGVYVPWSTLGLEFPVGQERYPGAELLLKYRYVYSYCLVNLCSALLILCSIKGKPLFRFFENDFLREIGKISYGIYLFHYPLMAALQTVAFKFVSKKSFAANPVYEIGLFVVYLPVLYLISYLSFHYFEKRFLQFKDRLKVA